jgi:hypothetical protein
VWESCGRRSGRRGQQLETAARPLCRSRPRQHLERF